MRTETVTALLDLNRQFYQNFGPAFAETRRRIQPGVRRVLESLPPSGRWLDLGCGNGWLAVEWARSGRRGLYCGLDFSSSLLQDAQAHLQEELLPEGLQVQFLQGDLSGEWLSEIQQRWAEFDGVLAFAVLHHLPSYALRLSVLLQAASLLPPGGQFIHSEWQVDRSPRWIARRLPWSRAGLAEEDLEEGDWLLDFRHQAGQLGGPGLRYVHLFSPQEYQTLAAESGFEISEVFESDGKEGNLGLYQVWTRR